MDAWQAAFSEVRGFSDQISQVTCQNYNQYWQNVSWQKSFFSDALLSCYS